MIFTHNGMTYFSLVVSQLVVSTDTKKVITLILAKYCIQLPDDGSLVIRNMLEQF